MESTMDPPVINYEQLVRLRQGDMDVILSTREMGPLQFRAQLVVEPKVGVML